MEMKINASAASYPEVAPLHSAKALTPLSDLSSSSITTLDIKTGLVTFNFSVEENSSYIIQLGLFDSTYNMLLDVGTTEWKFDIEL